MVIFVRGEAENHLCLHIKYKCRHDFWPLIVRHEADTGREIESSKLVSVPSPRTEDVKAWADLKGDLARSDAELSSAISMLADLAGVDGCVVLTDHLRLIGFGAVIGDALGVPDEIMEIDSSFSGAGQPSKSDRYGTRHRSAFRFCNTVEDAAAFVLSQDGGVKAIRRVGDNVTVYSEIDLTAQAWFPTGEDFARHRLDAV